VSAGSVFFVCDAEASIGFGHLSRCLQVAEALGKDRDIRFCGRFSPEARRRIAGRGFVVAPAPARNSGGLAVIDTMFDKEDMDSYDLPRLEALRRRFARLVVVSSALTVPARLPADVVIGHMLRSRRGRAQRFQTLAGLRYAPVSRDFRRARLLRTRKISRIGRVFLGFGSSRDIRGLRCVLDALALWKFTGEVDVLLSPFHERFGAALRGRASSYRLRLHANVKSVAPLLRRADVAFGTYGNITFEALCLGVPFLAVAVKDFQRAYAGRLARQGVLVSLGKDSELSTKTVIAALNSLTPGARASLSRRGRKAVDGLGIQRIARVVERQARKAEREMSCRT
jgi:spore coat polysaccharide biosynthesis predicted glycosyltransferase SpsG